MVDMSHSLNRLPYHRKLKQHHHICLDKEFKLDCKVWLKFLDGELRQVVHRPMMDLSESPTNVKDILFFSDTSASESKGGMGAVLQNRWLRGNWDTEFMKKAKPSIEYLELFTVCRCTDME